MIDYIPTYIPEPVKKVCEHRMTSKYDITTCNIRYISTWQNNELYVYFSTLGTSKHKYTSRYIPILYDCEKVIFYDDNIDKINALIQENVKRNNKPKYCKSLKK